MHRNSHSNGKHLLDQLESLLDDIQTYSTTVNQYVITSTTDLHGNITSVSQAFCEISGYSEEELLGKNHSIVRHPDMPSTLYDEMWQTITTGRSWQGEVKNLKKNGDYYWVDVNIEPIRDGRDVITGYVAIRQDITDQKRIEALTVTDELTGAYNRRFYNQIIDSEISRAKRDGHFLCLLMIDADNFKKYNDTYGHQAGDDVLKAISTTMKTTFRRAGDYVFRLGGEEFAVLFHVKEYDHAELISERSRQALYDLNIAHTGNPPHNRVTVSMGLMILEPTETYIVEEIYKYADEALYQAKQKGRNRIEVRENNEESIELF